ncbi:Fic family protein [Marinomonas rhodophyticola]|uniref:Fic family protein n=2 Tax=Marinomonas TaxID=28253 RepID=A0ABT3KDQ9_9GAMM|nr:Fic family protein [Marinomonas sp. KJ51-3]MCW4628650.1 Fic family protein [Marinomonas sp. KJ51-3]
MMISMTPFLESNDLGEYQDKIIELIKADAELNQSIPDSLRSSLEWLLRLVNSYYSNKIEGNPTHPKDLLKTQSVDADSNMNNSKDIQELLSHLEVQMKLSRSNVSPEQVVCQEFIKNIHQEFYAGFPEEALIVKNQRGAPAEDETGKPILIVPGSYRDKMVLVGKHEPPMPEEISRYMRWIEQMYNPTRIFGTNRLCAAAALHHRLAWVHPFIDGNGRTTRLVTDTYMRCLGYDGYGLWSLARGFARDTDAYYKALAQADMPRQGESDGKGILSKRGLIYFTKYFIDTALDQVRFFNDLLEPTALKTRMDIYFEFRSKGAIADINGKKTLLKIEARDIYKLLVDRGPLFRSQISSHFGKSEQTLRPVINQMRDEGLLKADPKQPVEPKLSPNIVETVFPGIW